MFGEQFMKLKLPVPLAKCSSSRNIVALFQGIEVTATKLEIFIADNLQLRVQKLYQIIEMQLSSFTAECFSTKVVQRVTPKYIQCISEQAFHNLRLAR